MDKVHVEYPRTYRVRYGSSAFCVGLGIVIVVPCLAAFGYVATHPVDGAGVVFTVLTGFILLGAFLIWDTLTTRLILYADAIEYRHSLVRRRLNLSEIAGRKLRQVKGFPIVVLVPNRTDLKKIQFARVFQNDDVFDRWFSRLHDMDADQAKEAQSQRNESLNRILSDERYGTSPEARERRLSFANRLAQFLNLLAMAVVLWAFFYPRPYGLAVSAIAALPVLAFVLIGVARGLFVLQADANDVRPNLVALVTGPSMFLVLRAFLDFHVYWTDVTIWWAMSAIIIAAATATVDRRALKRPVTALIVVPFAAAYGGGAAIIANALFDHTTGQIFETAVLSKRVDTGKYTFRYFELAPWGSQRQPSETSVSQADYNAVAIGTIICVDLRPGELGIRWFVIQGCGAGTAPEKAVSAVRTLAENGNGHAQVLMGRYYANGYIVARDNAAAVEWYRQAAAQGDADGMNSLGYKIDHGEGIVEDPAAAKPWYEKASAKGDLSATNNLGLLYLNGRGVARDFVEARRLFTLAADKGHTQSMRNLAYMAANGAGEIKDEAKAFDWYKKAALAGDPDAQFDVGNAFYSGKGTAQNYVQARLFFELAAKQGVPAAQFYLGSIYETAQGVPQNWAESSRYYRLAADRGMVEAIYNLSQAYRFGHGVEQDMPEARKYMLIAATKGFAEAQNNIGYMMDHGEGGPTDPVQAAVWFRRGAAQGAPDAAHSLAGLYISGRGVERDLKTALFWLKIAAQRYPAGDERLQGVTQMMSAVTERLAAKDIEDVERSVVAWMPVAETPPP